MPFVRFPLMKSKAVFLFCIFCSFFSSSFTENSPASSSNLQKEAKPITVSEKLGITTISTEAEIIRILNSEPDITYFYKKTEDQNREFTIYANKAYALKICFSAKGRISFMGLPNAGGLHTDIDQLRINRFLNK